MSTAMTRRRRGSGRAELLQSARRAFGASGYLSASIETIAADAGLTTGAVYHHFGGKLGLFEAVARSVEQEIVDAVVRAAGVDGAALDRFAGGVGAMLDCAEDPAVSRIVFVEAPTVLGPDRWREIEKEYAFGMLLEGFRGVALSLMADWSPDVAAPLVLGAMTEGARLVAAADDPRAVRADVERALLRMISGLFAV